MKLYIGLLNCVAYLVIFATLPVYGAMYEASIDSFEPDADIDKNYVTLGTLRVTRKKRNCFILDGDFEIQQNWGNENVVFYDIKNIKGDGPPLMSGKANFCEFFSMDNSIVKAVREASDLPPKDTCPLPKGKYSITGFELKEDDLPPVMPKGQYVVSARMDSAEGKQIIAYKIFTTVK